MKEDLLATLLASLDELNPSERKVAQYILRHAKEVVQLSVKRLSKNAGVSEPTVIRFCRSMGCKGYQDFKVQLAVCLASGEDGASSIVRQNNSTMGTTEKVFTNATDSLQSLQKDLKDTDIEHAIQLIRTAGRIDIYGSGNSGIVALSAQYSLSNAKVSAVAHRDSLFQLVSAKSLKTDSLAIIISQTGESQTCIALAQQAQQQGASVLGITPKDSSLSQYCTTLLACPNLTSDTSVSTRNAMICQLTVFDILVAHLAADPTA